MKRSHNYSPQQAVMGAVPLFLTFSPAPWAWYHESLRRRSKYSKKGHNAEPVWLKNLHKTSKTIPKYNRKYEYKN